MNWSGLTFDWNRARAFLATAEEGSLSAAARVLHQAQPTLGRQVAALEEELGVALFERVGRQLILTPSGLELLGHVRSMAEAASRVTLAASGQSQTIDGVVRITASDIMSAYHLPPILRKLREVAPKLDVEVVAANDIRDLQRREADIAIRHVRPDQPELVAKLVAEPTGRFYAAPSYVQIYGVPTAVSDLQHHRFVSFGDPERTAEYLQAIDIPLSADHFRSGSDSGLVAWQMVLAGLGIGIMSDAVAAITGGVEVVLPQMAPIRFPVWLTAHRELHSSRRIRLTFDVLAEGLSTGPHRV